MITIYNETTNAWTKTKINERISKFTMNVELSDGRERYIDVITSNDVKYINDISEFVSMDGCRNISNDIASVKFQKKDERPMIVSSTIPTMSSDILFVSINLNKRIIKSIKNTRAAVLNHFIASGIFTAVVSIKEFEKKFEFEITLHDNEAGVDSTYKFAKSGRDMYSLIITSESAPNVEKPTYRITRFRPAKPTDLIFVNSANKDVFVNSFEKADKHNVNYFRNIDELIDYINELKKIKYKAATLFVDNTCESSKTDKAYFESVKANFSVVNLMNETGKITFIK